tara:strand:- start:1682 stop:2998 length:1317 start_codon:yes stop_codon:yes gene_type:complete
MIFSFPQVFIAFYLILVFCVGFLTPKENSEKGFLFANRKATLPALVMSLVSTWYGGILEVGRYSYEHGIVTFVMFGIFYYIAALIYALFIASKISESNLSSIPELFYNSFNKKSAILAAIIIVFLASPAPYIKMLAIIIDYVYSIGFINSILLGTIFSVFYTVKGGFRSVLRTDIIQFSMMFIGFLGILIYLYLKFGGYEFLTKELPPIKFSIPGNLNWSYLFAWGFIALVTFIDPNFYQRSFASSSKKNARKAIIISILFWFIFDFISVVTGLYAAAIISEVKYSPFLDLASYALPPILQGLFIVSMIAIIMSTIDSFVFVSGFTIGRDLLGKRNDDKINVSYTKIGIIVSASISTILAIFFENAVDIWYVTGSFGVSALLMPMLCALYNKRVASPFIFILAPLIITGIWFIFTPSTIDPMYPGLISSVLYYLLFRK